MVKKSEGLKTLNAVKYNAFKECKNFFRIKNSSMALHESDGDILPKHHFIAYFFAKFLCCNPKKCYI